MNQKPTYEELENELKTLKKNHDFEFLLDFSGVIVVEIDEKGIVQQVNKRACEILGYGQEEIIGKNWFENFIPAKIKNEILPISKKLLSGERENADHYENPILTKNGEERIIHWHNKPVKNGDGTFSGHISIGEDITDRIEIEKLLKENEYLLEESQKISKIGSYILDFKSHLWRSSSAVDEIFGIDQKYDKDLQSWLNIVHPEDLKMMQDYFSINILTNHERFNKEYRILKINSKKECWVNGIGEIEFDKDGNPMKLVGTIQDITVRKIIELKLINRERQLYEAQESIQLGYFELDLNTKQFHCNSIFDSIIGYTKNAIRSHEDYRKIIHPKDLDLNDKTFLDCVKNRQPYKRTYRIISNNKKELKWIKEQGQVIYENGEPSKFTGTILDITDQKNREEELKLQNKELNKLGEKLVEKNKLLEDSRKIFKTFFDKNPVSLWEEDFTAVKQLLDEKKSQTRNLKKYLDDNPNFVFKCISKLKILNVNDITLELLGVKNKKELISHLSANFNEKSFEIFKKELLAIASNKKEFSGETEFIRLDGTVINALIKFVVTDNIESKAIISIVDITELNKIKEKIEKSEKQFRELYEKSGDAILIIENGVFIECNQATVNMLEYKTKEDFLNAHPSQLSPIFQEDGQKSFDKSVKMMNIALKKGTHRFEWIHVKKTGINFPVEVLLTAISKEQDNEIIHCVWRDITYRKMAESTLKESALELRNSQEIAKLGSYNLDLINMTFTSSTALNSILGLKSKHSKTFETWRTITHPEEIPENQKMLNNCIKNNTIFNREFRIITKNKKKLKWVHSIGECKYIDGQPTNLIGTIQDITERKLNELAVKSNEQKLLEIQKIANLGTYEINLVTNSVTSSEIYNSILGIKNQPKNNKGWWKSITHPEDYERGEQIWQECIKEGKNYNDEYRVITKNKKVKWIHDIAEIQYKSGVPVSIVGTIQDVTELKLNELAVKLNERKLLEIQKIANIGTFEIDIRNNTIITSSVFDIIVPLKSTKFNSILEWWKYNTHPEDYEDNRLMWKDCIRKKNIFDREYRILIDNKDKIKWVHGIAEVLFEENKAVRVIGSLQDITARKVAELKLKENEIKLNEAQKITKLGSFIFDHNDNLFESTHIFDEIVGIDDSFKKDFLGYVSLVHPDDFELFKQFMKESGVSTTPNEFRIIRHSDKQTIWVKGMSKIKTDKFGLPNKVIGTIQDITSRKISEEKVKRSDAVLNQINSLIKITDENGYITYASPSFKTVLGYEPEEMLGDGWWLKTSKDSASAKFLRESVMGVVNNNNPISKILKNRWVKSNNGKSILYQWTGSKGVGNSWIFIGIDVTEKQEKEKQFKTLTETAHDAIVLTDHDGLIFEWNHSSQETFGYSRKEMLGKSITILMPENYRSQYKEGFSKTMKNSLKTDYRNNIVEGLTKDGWIFPMELSLNYWQSNDKNVYCYFIRDITQREREEKIKQMIFNIAKKANETLDLDKFFYFIKTELGKLINTNNFFIAVYNTKTDMISTPYMVDEIDDLTDFPKGKTLTGYVIDNKKALLTKEMIMKSESNINEQFGLGPQAKCWLGVPILIDDIAIGAIVVQSYTDENAFTKSDVSILELVASNIGQVIKKDEDFAQIRLLNKALIQSPQAVIITNINGEIEYTNPAFTNLTGYTEEEAIGKTPNILKSGKQDPVYYNHLWKTITSGKTWEGEFVNQRKNGSHYLVEANISSLKNKEGKITHFIGVQEDITKKRKLERKFISAFIEAQEVEKQNFGEELHDGISQILSAESMYIDLLIDQNQDRLNDKAKFLTKIKDLNQRAVNETRNIAHGLMSSQLKQSGLLISVENICIDFSSSKNVVFSFFNKDLKETELSQEIKINLFRVVQELTTNITRYSSATEASVSFRKITHNNISLIVKDNGIGMDYDKIKKERKVTGLKNVERRIIFLKGTFKIESSPRKGTIWNIKIPL